MRKPPFEDPEYLAGWIHDRLAEDPSFSELGIGVRIVSDRVVLVGTVATAERREQVGNAVAGMVPGYEVRNDLTVPDCAEPTKAETLS